MQIQIFLDYQTLPPIDPVAGLSLSDVRYYYDQLRPQLMGKNWKTPDIGGDDGG